MYIDAVYVEGGFERSAVWALAVLLCCCAVSRSHSGVPLPFWAFISSIMDANGSREFRSEVAAGLGALSLLFACGWGEAGSGLSNFRLLG